MRALVIAGVVVALAGCVPHGDPRGYSSSQSAAPVQRARSFPGWEQYGDWHVKAIHGEMDTLTIVKLFTPFRSDPAPGSTLLREENFSIGFILIGGNLLSFSPQLGGLEGSGTWPRCEYDASAVSVDGAGAVPLLEVRSYGYCRSVDISGRAMTALLSGKNAKVRVRFSEGTISLNGFAEAWHRAQMLGAGG